MQKTQRAARSAAFAFILLSFFIGLALPPASASRNQQQPPTPAPTPPATPQRDERLWQRALRLHRDAIVVDGHNDITSAMVDENYDLGVSSVGRYHTDLARMKQGGVTGQFFAIYVGNDFVQRGEAARRALEMIDVVNRAIERHPRDLMYATSVADIRRAKREGRIAALMGIENGAAIENSLLLLRNFYRLGIRYMTLTHNFNNDWADSGRDTPRHNGLTEFGREVVREMNRLGMMVDVSHVSDKTMSDVLDITRAPIIASHSSARALGDHPRNIPDDLLRRIGQNRGVVMVNFYPAFIDQRVIDATRERAERLRPQLEALREQHRDDPQRLREETDRLNAANPLPPTPLSVLIDHIEHIRRVAGADSVGLGSDFDGVPTLPQDMTDISMLPNITYELLRRGWSESDIRKLLGENLLRAFSEAERVARASSRTISGEGSMMRLTQPARQ